jgi:hypothetical protein
MATFVFETDVPPVQGAVGLTAEEEVLTLSPVVLILDGAVLGFHSGFED